jgi:hypothetical protein
MMTWFENLTGFPETSPVQVRENITVDGETMKSLANGGQRGCGWLVCWRLTRAARYPLDQPAIAHFLRLDYRLISKVRMSSLDRARDTTDPVAASIDASRRIVEHAILRVDLSIAARRRAGSFSPNTS